MKAQKKIAVLPALFVIVALFQASPLLARSDDFIQREIEAQIEESSELRGSQIEVHVEQRLVMLTGQVRLYEQKLISDRIAWTTPGVFEVDNEIRVEPKRGLTDAAIEQKIKEIVKVDERFRSAGVEVRVDNGAVSLKGSFLSVRDPTTLKHKVARIEGVVRIEMSVTFLS